MDSIISQLVTSPAIGRLAPSPTGALHLGNARTFLLTWLSIRQQQGQLVLRIEDLDSPRVKPWAIRSTLEDLKWLGLDWDWGPDSIAGEPTPCTEPMHPRPSMIQTQRLPRYREVLDDLIAQGRVYACTCSRSEIAEAASAPHENARQPLDGLIYPGTCRPANIPAQWPIESNSKFAWRWAFDDEESAWLDQLHGLMQLQPSAALGDFVIAKGDGVPAYQLAVVVDDHDMGVNEVVRGDDLLFSTFRQLAIIRHFGWTEPDYWHVPLMVGPDGRRLAKRHGDTRLSFFRDQGIAPEVLIGYLAFTVNLLDSPRPIRAQELIGQLDWSRVPTAATAFNLDTWLPIFQAQSSP